MVLQKICGFKVRVEGVVVSCNDSLLMHHLEG